MPDDDDLWVVLHCYNGFEDAVIEKIRQRVPEAELRRLKWPGYLAWRWDPSGWDDVRTAGGVTGYVGSPKEPELQRLSDLRD